MRQLRFLLSILVLISASTVAKAQFVKFSFGIEGGGLGTYIKTDSELYPGFGYGGYGGANFELRLGRVVGFYGEAIYAYQTGNYTLLTSDGYDSGTYVNLTQQYMHIPVSLHLWMGRGAIFEVGFQQSILLNAKYVENPGYNNELEINPDSGALKYYASLLAGFKFNFGRVVYLNIRGTYGLSPAYVVMGNGVPVITASVGLGFRLYTYRKSAFK